MYRRLAQEALEAAQKTRHRGLRADYLEIAEHWKSVANDIEKLLVAAQQHAGGSATRNASWSLL
jgi:hypothetical protein